MVTGICCRYFTATKACKRSAVIQFYVSAKKTASRVHLGMVIQQPFQKLLASHLIFTALVSLWLPLKEQPFRFVTKLVPQPQSRYVPQSRCCQIQQQWVGILSQLCFILPVLMLLMFVHQCAPEAGSDNAMPILAMTSSHFHSSIYCFVNSMTHLDMF